MPLEVELHSPRSSRATHTHPVTAPSVLRSSRVHLSPYPSGRGLAWGRFIFKQASSVPHAAGPSPREGATMSPTMIQRSTMVAETKTHFLSCVAFPYPETAPTEGEQIGPSPGLGQKFLQCANDATRKPSEETRRAVFF